MVIQCAFTNCKNKRYRWARQSFHQFPWRDPERTQLWLLAAGLDINPPAEKLLKWKLCSDHFRHEDFAKPRNIKDHTLLTTTAVPSISPDAPTATDSSSHSCSHSSVPASSADTMPVQCVAYGCGKTFADNVSLHTFPKDPDDFRKWEKQVQRTRSQWFASASSHLCSDHFGREYFMQRIRNGVSLRPGAMPTIFIRPPCSSCEGKGCSNCAQLPTSHQRTTPGDTNVSVSLSFCFEIR